MQIGNNQDDYLPPLGLGIIYTSIEKYHNVKFIDALADNLDIEHILDILHIEKPDVVCINIFTTNYLVVKDIVENQATQTHWIIGGTSTMSLHPEIFHWETNNCIDIIYGDGELIIKDIIENNIKESPVAQNGNRRYFVVDANSQYYVQDISNEIINRSIFREPLINYHQEQEICIYTSRGCPNNCAFCAAAHSRHNGVTSKIRRKTKDSVILELKRIKELYPTVTSIRVLDDLFLSSEKTFIDAVEIFSQYEFSWQAMCHIKPVANISDELLKIIRQSGCKELFIGIESGSPHILEKLHKTSDVPLIKKTIKRIVDVGIKVKGYFICGLPTETITDLQQTLDLASELTKYGNFRNSTFQFRPYYGTELCDEIIATTDISKDDILNKMTFSNILNKKIRNKSFNYDSGNYSSVPDDILIDYIYQINKLNE